MAQLLAVEAFLFVVFICLLNTWAYQLRANKHFFPRSQIYQCEVVGVEDSGSQRWSNPAYPPDQLNTWYLELQKSLLTVGAKGISPSHINSLIELLKSHERVRVKVASDRMNTMDVSKLFTEDLAFQDVGELLEVRKREFMFGRKPSKM